MNGKIEVLSREILEVKKSIEKYIEPRQEMTEEIISK